MTAGRGVIHSDMPEQTVLLLVYQGATFDLAAGQMGIYQQGDGLRLTITTRVV